MEGDPGTRRYKWFRPRQAYRGGVPATTAGLGLFATISVYNSSTGPTVLVIRDWSVAATAAITLNTGYNQGRLNGTPGGVTPLFPGDRAGAGLVDYQAAGAVLSADYRMANAVLTSMGWLHNFPFAIVPPGWAFFIQQQSANKLISGGFLWEEVSIDELEYTWDF
jgi:hypothetical protein